MGSASCQVRLPLPARGLWQEGHLPCTFLRGSIRVMLARIFPRSQVQDLGPPCWINVRASDTRDLQTRIPQAQSLGSLCPVGLTGWAVPRP